jgi:DNA-binding transcriptional LysR family regulator
VSLPRHRKEIFFPMLSIRQLRYALAVWSEGTFVGASEKLHISQPAISEQVSQLEAEIGFDLFQRTGHGVQVTDLGRAFLIEAEDIYLGMLRLGETASLLRGTQGEIFSIGMSSGVMPFVVPEIVRALADLDLKLRLDISTTTTRVIHRRLCDDSLDVGITVETNPRALPSELLSERVASDRMVLTVPRGHRFARRKSVGLEEVANEPLIMNELSVGYSDVVLSMFSDVGLQAKIAAVCDNFATIFALVGEGTGIAIVPLLSTGLSGGRVVNLPLTPERRVHVTLVRRARKMPALPLAYANAIRDRLVEAGRGSGSA